MCKGLMNGQNATFISFGPHDTGKTYTALGNYLISLLTLQVLEMIFLMYENFNQYHLTNF